MGYIEKNLSADETVFFRTKKHYVIFLTPFLFLLIAVFFSISNPVTDHIDQVFHDTFIAHNMNHLVGFLFLALAVFWGFKQWLLYQTSDFAVTNKRVIIKEGFVQRFICDTRLASISHVSVEQPMLGQILNYGTIIIQGYGNSADHFIQVANPVGFQRSVHDQLDKIGR